MTDDEQNMGTDLMFNMNVNNIELLYNTQATLIISSAHDANIAYEISKHMQPSHFSEPAFQRLWSFIQVKLESNSANDINLTALQLEAQKMELNLDLTEYLDLVVEDTDLLLSYAKIVKSIVLQRKLRNKVDRIFSDSSEISELLENIKLTTNSIENEISDITLSKSLPEMFNDLQEYLATDDLPQIYKFGLPEIDENIIDFAPGNTVIIGATPGVGKTSLGIVTAINNGWAGVPTHFFSLEMSERQLIARFLNAVTGIPAKKILRKALSYEEKENLLLAKRTLERLPIRVTNYADMPLNALLQSMRDSKIKYGTEVFFVDYVQLINYEGRTKREEASFVAQKLKSLALELDACIVQMSQLSRNNKVEPDMQDLKETSDLEQAASLIILMYMDKLGITDHLKTDLSYPVFFKVAKQRNGSVFKNLLDFIPTKMQYRINSFKIEEYEKELTQSKRSKKDEEN